MLVAANIYLRPLQSTTAGFALACRAVGCGFNPRGWTNTQCQVTLKIFEEVKGRFFFALLVLMTGPFLCDTLSILNFAYLILQFWQNSILQGLIFTISTDKYAKGH